MVAPLRDGEPVRDGALRIWNHFRGVNVALRVIEGRGTIRNESVDEVLYDLASDTGNLPSRRRGAGHPRSRNSVLSKSHRLSHFFLTGTPPPPAAFLSWG